MDRDAVLVPTWYYQQCDADWSRQDPGEAFGGWKQADLELAPGRTALVMMHAWDVGSSALYPGWWRAEEYFLRAQTICRTVFPPLLAAVRASAVRLVHVGCLPYASRYPGYALAC